jgi:membrane carboxypeptidase/penicillin-binding protein PbpC
MAPEQRLGLPADAAADQYAFAVSLVEALCGQRPAAVPPAALARGEATELPPAASGLPLRIRRALQRALATAPADRFPGMTPLLDSLQAASPRRRRGRALLVLALGGLAASSFGVARLTDRPVTECSDTAAMLASVWGPQTRGALVRAFDAVDVAWAETTRTTVVASIDAWAQTWAQEREATCIAGFREGGLDPAEARRRIDCLDDHLERVGALVQLFASADAQVLARAVKEGVIDADAAAAALREAVPGLRKPFPALAPHLADRARAEEPQLGSHHLTIDGELQKKLEALALEAVEGKGEQLQVAILVADHASGEILASVGSAGYQADLRQGFVDMTEALRSPGSTLKPLVYALAFDEGLGHPETMIDDRPMSFGTYAPQNFDKLYMGTIRMREALQLSRNIPVVALTDALGPAKLMAAMQKAGMTPVFPGDQPGLAIALGGVGVTLSDMVQLYAAIARGGVVRPLSYRLDAEVPEGQRVVSEVAAWEVGDILAGLAPPPGAPSNRLAYKTGTSYGHRDAWAIGFDGKHVIGVWMGRADGTPVPGAFGADVAAPVLFQAFNRLKGKLDPQPPAPASTLLVANSELPQPLQRFRSRSAVFEAEADAPAVAFPPDGAEVELLASGLKVKVAGGTAPFTWLADGVPVVVASDAREAMLAMPGAGFVTLSVIDAEGRSDRVQVQVR